MDDLIRSAARAARTEVETSVDVDAGLSAARTGGPADITPHLHRPVRRTGVAWLGAAAAVTLLVAGGVWWLGSDRDDTLQTADPATTIQVAPTAPAATATTAPATTSPTTTTDEGTAPSTTIVPSAPVLPPGSIDLGPDDLIARSIDGDVWWYPDALGASPGERILLIDRADPRSIGTEGGPPNFIDQVAGTYDGALVYSDCCEPVSGNLFAITEPGAEAELWSSPSGLSDRARLWGVGNDPELEPTGTRVLAYGFDWVNLVDLATGAQQFMSPLGASGDPDGNATGAPFNTLDAAWTSRGGIALLGWSEEQGLTLTEHAPDELRTERRRIPLDLATESYPRAEFVGTAEGRATVAVFGDDGLQLLDVDTERWETVEVAQTFDVPRNASFVRLSPDGTLMTWIVDDVAHLQRAGGAPIVWRDGVAEIWFPVARSGQYVDQPDPGTTVPETTIPAIDVTDWRTLQWEHSGIAGLPNTQVIHDENGTPISYDPTSRTLTRHGVPTVTAILPASYGRSWLRHAGPDDVVYLQVDAAVPAELAADLVAVSLGADDAGREIARWSDVADALGDSQLVATPDGLVTVYCCDAAPIRPAPGAPVLVPWVDRSGSDGRSTAPLIQIAVDRPTMTVTRTDVGLDATRAWTFELRGEPTLRGMPNVVSTFDGGFVALLYGDHITAVRGWPDGDVETVVLGFPVGVVDRSGRVLVHDGDAFARVEVFPDRTIRPSGRPEVDVEAGTVTLPDLSAISAPWLTDPVAFADAVAGQPEVNEIRAIDALQYSEFEWLVTVTTSNLFDDSVFAVRWALVLERGDDGRFSFLSGTWGQVCQPGRGHQDVSNELCV